MLKGVYGLMSVIKVSGHSRESGIAKTGVRANIGLPMARRANCRDAGRNPVMNDSVHPELVEGFLIKEWFDRLTMNGKTGSPFSRG